MVQKTVKEPTMGIKEIYIRAICSTVLFYIGIGVGYFAAFNRYDLFTVLVIIGCIILFVTTVINGD